MLSRHPGARCVGFRHSPAFCVGPRRSLCRCSLSVSGSGARPHSLCRAPRSLCRAPPLSLCAGPRRCSAHAVRGGGPQLRSACHSFSLAGPIRCAGPPADPRVSSSDPYAGSRGPQLRPACHPSSPARSLFPGENPKPYFLGEKIKEEGALESEDCDKGR